MSAASRNFQIPLIPAVKNHAGANIADAYRSLVRLALNANLPPATDLHLDAVPRVSVFFPPPLFAQVTQIAELHGLTFQAAVAGLAVAGADKNTANKAPELSDIVPFKARPEQVIFYKAITQGLAASKIVVAEASTGVGKGRALMAAAIKSAQAKKTPTIVAAPTIVVVNQLWGELQKLRTEDKLGLTINATILPGAAEFADDIKLIEWLSEEDNSDQDPAVTEWIRNGAPHTTNDAMSQVAREQGITLCWMMSDLHNIATNLPIEDFVLKTDAKDKTINSQARQLLANVREAANRKQAEDNDTHAGADIILCTHAMLALGQLTKWAVLPQPKVLFIDEAHLLEETISRINSHQISLFAVSYKLGRFCRAHGSKKGTIPRNTLTHAKAFLRSCQAISKNDAREKLNDDPEKYESVRKGLSDLAELVRSKAFSAEPTIQKDMYSLLSNAVNMMNDRAKSSTHLQFSPDKRYPSLSIGADSIGPQAGAMWKAAEGGAVLASATMYISDEYGNQKCDYVVRNLAIPLARLDTPLPVVSEYLYTLPSLHLPKPAAYAALSRPDTKDRADATLEDAWLKNIAAEIANIANPSEGGTLVLTNSYVQIKGIEKHLQKSHPEVASRIISQVRGTKFSVAINAFKASHQIAGRPIMLGLGPAWTGLNLSDEEVPAENDTLLSNLVIACCPIGLNQTPTMLRRIALTNTSAISKEALLTLKQGLGRLIRRDNVKGRKIWILDARIWSDQWLRQFTGPAKRLLAKYKKIEYFGSLE